MKQSFEFELVFVVPAADFDPYHLSDAVLAAGFEDAVIGTGTHGLLAVEIDADGEDAESVIVETARAITRSLPRGSALREVRPDLVTLAEVAAKLGVTRQTLQQRVMPFATSGGLYRIDEIWQTLRLAVATPAPGHRRARFDLGPARKWFLAGLAARRLNAKLALGEIDPVSLRRVEDHQLPHRASVGASG
ncbi:MAG: hypothetical protein GVY27_00115 [Deinococcus-Thermus bacterium]|nr:hypothetical protein [Deinococcota bacterium]